MTDTIRVADLLAIDALGTRLLAGAGGTGRRVLWAHSCELESPDRWLGQGELLMTVGLCVPTDEHGQVELVRRLDAAGLAGMAIGDDEVGPPLTDRMLKEADALAFPVLMTSHSVPFAAIGRTVAAANSSHQARQVLTLSRLYHALLEARGSEADFLGALGEIFNVRMTAIDLITGVTLLPGPLTVDVDDVRRRVGDSRVRTGEQMVKVAAVPDPGISAWRVPSQRPTVLVIDEREAVMLDSFTIVHLGRAVSIEADRRAEALLARDSRLAGVLSMLYSGEGNIARLEAEAQDNGLDTAALVALVGRGNQDVGVVGAALSLAGIPHAAVERNQYWVICLAAADLARAREVTTRFELRTGASRRFSGLGELGQAVLNAEWALESIGGGDAMTVDYDDASFSLMPRTAGEANEIVRRVLGPLVAEDAASRVLLDTLCAFLDENRNWTAAAERLGIHRQTLAYRLKHIERATGRSLRRSQDLAELWIARTALRQP